MSSGGALFRLLWRPVALAWFPLGALCSVTAMMGAALFWEIGVAGKYGAVSAVGTVQWMFPAMIGLLVGQAIKELQHCHFSWALPALRRRLLPGAVTVGLIVSLASREILVGMFSPLLFFFARRPEREIAEAWQAFPSLSIGVVVVSFMAFWIGVRSSKVTWLVVMAPLVLFSTPITRAVGEFPLLAITLTAPLTAFLMYRTFSASAARRQPFIGTKPLSGDVRRADQRRRLPAIRGGRGAVLRVQHLGDDVANWVRAGIYENHGFRHPVVRGAAVSIALVSAVYMISHTIGWLFASDISSYAVIRRAFTSAQAVMILSPIIAVPLSVLLTVYCSISLTRRVNYPLSRERMADIEFWGGLVESLIICGVLTALLIGYWSFAFGGLGLEGSRAWPTSAGGRGGWIPLLVRPVVLVFLLMPVTQLFRLRYVRAPNDWGSIRLLINMIGLMIVLTTVVVVVGGNTTTSAGWIPLRASIREFSLLVDVQILALAVLVQMAYRRLVNWHFRTADLV